MLSDEELLEQKELERIKKKVAMHNLRAHICRFLQSCEKTMRGVDTRSESFSREDYAFLILLAGHPPGYPDYLRIFTGSVTHYLLPLSAPGLCNMIKNRFNLRSCPGKSNPNY